VDGWGVGKVTPPLYFIPLMLCVRFKKGSVCMCVLGHQFLEVEPPIIAHGSPDPINFPPWGENRGSQRFLEESRLNYVRMLP
jgi:hypothetical protein